MIKAKHPIVGLTGLKASGKDTLAMFLCEHHGFVRLAFADPLKISAAAALGCTVADLEAHKNDPHYEVAFGPVFEELGMIQPISRITVREYLQRYGTEAHRDVFGDTFWIDPIIDRAFNLAADQPVVITDARFENEQRAVKNAGGKIVEIIRPGKDVGDGHASENVSHGLTDIVIHNSTTLHALQAAASELVDALVVS